MTRAYLGLGANLGDPAQTLRAAIRVIDTLPPVQLVSSSSLYRTPPLGPAGQPDYCNAVLAVDTALAADDLLARMLGVERAFGRVRDGERWGPRMLDIDVLVYGDQQIQSPGLTVPHPEIANRAFVLVPLAEIAPALVLPGGAALADMVATTDQTGMSRWDHVAATQAV